MTCYLRLVCNPAVDTAALEVVINNPPRGIGEGWVEVVINNPPRGSGESSGGVIGSALLGGGIIKSLPRRLCEVKSCCRAGLRMVAPQLPDLHFTMQTPARGSISC